MELLPLHFLLSRLEEDVEFQQKLTSTYLAGPPRYGPETARTVMEALRRLSDNLRLISLVISELEEVNERELKEEALILSSESLSLASVLLPAVERLSPFFLEGLRVDEKPLLEKMEEVLAEIESAVEKLELSSTRELVETLERLAQTLECSLKAGERLINNPA
ncbi:MAG: hypothetical protein GXO03_01180 [Aquificae bacterium]|nr:hypothetical protein [Aquificota bacterium]